MAVSPVRRGSGNPRNVVVEWTRAIVDRAIERPERVSIPELVDQAIERFSPDSAFMTNLAMMNLREIVRAAVSEAIHDTRRGPKPMRIVRDTIMSEQEHLAEAPALMQALAIRWGRFREWDGTHQILLPKMNRVELLRAAAIRRERAMHEIEYALFFERLAARLPDDTTTVEQAVPYDQIQAEYEAAQMALKEGGDGDSDAASDS